MKLNKLFFSLLVITLFLGFTSCSSDDDNNNNNDSIVGTWVYSKVEVEVTAEKDMEAIKQFTVSSIMANTTIFREDGTYSIVYSEDDIENGTYSYKNGVLTRTWTIYNTTEKDSDAHNVTISGNILNLISDKDEIMMDEAKHEYPNSGITNIKLTYYFNRK